MNPFARDVSRWLMAPLAAGLLCASSHLAVAADNPDPDAPKGAAVTVLTAAKSCFSNIVEISGLVLAREETAVRPERQGMKVAEVLADAGDTVTAGQTLARLNLPDGGGTALVQAPIAGLISSSTAVVGATASGKGEALFSIVNRGEFDMVGLVPTQDVVEARGQSAGRHHDRRRRRPSTAGCAGSRRPSSPIASSARPLSPSPPTAACW